MISILTHVVLSVFVGGILSWLVGHLTPAVSVLSLLAGFLGSIYVFKIKTSKENYNLKTDSFFVVVILFFVGLFTVRQFLYLFYEVGASLKTLNANNYGDLPLHISIIKNLASGDKFWPDFISLAGTKIEYPFGMDFYNSFWQILGVPLQAHLFVSGVVLLFATTVAVYSWAGILGVIALFFNGAWGGLAYFTSGIASDYQSPLMWKNIFNAVIVTQRGFLIGFPLGLYIIKSTYGICYKKLQMSSKEKYLLGFFWGMLPLFHTYTFFIISLVMACMVIHSKKVKEFLTPLFIAMPISLIWILPLTNFFKKASIIWFQKGWGIKEGEPVLSHLWNNYGPWFLLFSWCYYHVWWGRYKNYRFLFNMGLLFFILFNFVMMAPWEWDNIKILIWPYLIMTYVAAQILNEIKRPYIKNIIYSILGFTGFISVLAISNGKSRGYQIYDTYELNATEGALKTVSPHAVFAAYPTFNHQLTYFGKKVVLGYSGHIWSHGLRDEGRDEKLKKLMMGAENWKELAQMLGVTHIFWGPFEQNEYKVQNQPWRSLKNLSTSKVIQIYEID